MKKKQIKKALKSKTPANNMYALIPESKRDTFKKFALFFGLSEEKISTILANEKHK